MLLRSEDTVTGITETWNDICLIVQMVIKSRHEYIHIGMRGLNSLDTVRSCHQAHQTYLVAAK